MTNMSYCRFENTFRDLQDCYQSMFDGGLSDSEQKYRQLLIDMCKDIINDVEDDELQDDSNDALEELDLDDNLR